jgi:hypothetical protein
MDPLAELSSNKKKSFTDEELPSYYIHKFSQLENLLKHIMEQDSNNYKKNPVCHPGSMYGHPGTICNLESRLHNGILFVTCAFHLNNN